MLRYSFFQPKRLIPILLATCAGMALFACNRHHHGHWGKTCAEPDQRAQKAGRHLARKLDLNDNQRQEVENLVKGTLLDACELAPARADLGRTLVGDLRAEKADPVALEGKLLRMEQGLDTLKGRMLERYAKLHQVLTPEQRRKMADFLEKHLPESK
jgi:Spy/CpxP family protein refolding chaperone